jgi:hypothetical protein
MRTLIRIAKNLLLIVTRNMLRISTRSKTEAEELAKWRMQMGKHAADIESMRNN